MRVSDLHGAEYNPRRISDEALAGLGRSMERFGVLQPLVWNERTGNLVGGHQRLRVLVDRGVESTKVVVVDLSETEEKAANVSLNNPHISGEFTDNLDALLGELKLDPDFDGFDDLLLSELLSPEPVRSERDEPVEPDVVEITRRGDVWHLGQHRVMCGDSTNADDVSVLFSGEQPEIIVTDPPYGVEYDAEWRERALGGPRAKGVVTNDERVDWSEAWELSGCIVAYVWHAGRHASTVEDSLLRAGFQIRCQIIWAKSRVAISRGHYHWQHEPCWYAFLPGNSARWSGARDQTTVWEIPTLQKLDTGHSTQKPVECMARPLRNHDFELAYDPFSGSGSTFIAGEDEGVRVLGMEIAPQYVDVIVRRWQEYTGQTATLASTGQTFAEVVEERSPATGDSQE